MPFPINIHVDFTQIGIKGTSLFDIAINSGLTTLVGPNGSGKTQLLRALKQKINTHLNGKKVRFLSAGRIGMLEQFRSDFDGHRNNNPMYESANYGSKSDSSRRYMYETITGDFHTLSIRTDILIKVQERLRKLFNRNIFIEWDGGNLKVLFSRIDFSSPLYSSAREASGLLHLIAILTALYDDEIGALILDEPEVSLHPQLQAFLLREMKKVSGHPEENKKLIIMATHSTEMITLNRPQDIPNFVFCYDLFTKPIQINPSAGEIHAKKISELLARMGQEHKLSLFSKRPVLVEGPSDSIICSGIDRLLDLYSEAAGAQILPVIGKGEMPTVIKFMRLIGKEPIVLTDADSFTDDLNLIYIFTNNEKANTLAQKNGADNGNIFAKTIYSDFCQVVESKWETLARFGEQHNYWVNKKSEDDLNKVKRRAFFTTLFSEKPEVKKMIDDDTLLNGIKIRLEVLLELLEELGCYILRYGTIESYYRFADRNTSDGKPSAAVEEIEGMQDLPKSEIESKYIEIVRCLKYASKKEQINETEAIREILLSVVAPVLAILDDKTNQEQINSIMRNILGERADLFKFSTKMQGSNIYLVIDIQSKILDIKCFPFEISKNDNLLSIINIKLGLA